MATPRRLLLLPLMPALLTGCVAVWGQSYKVIYAKPDATVIQYDPLFMNRDKMQAEAQQRCALFGKGAQLVETKMGALGMAADIYNCTESAAVRLVEVDGSDAAAPAPGAPDTPAPEEPQ